MSPGNQTPPELAPLPRRYRPLDLFGRGALGVPVALWQLLFFAAPLGFLVVVTFWQVKSFRLEPAFVFDNWEKILGSTVFHRALIYTVEVASATGVLSVLLAFPAAYTLAFTVSPRMRNWITGFLIIPIFSSYLLRIYAWQVVLSDGGIINSLLAPLGLGPLPLLGGAFSLMVGLLTLTLPLAVLILTFAMTGIDRSLTEAAANMGAGPLRVIWNVLVPAIKGGLMMAFTTSFLLAFGDYVSPAFMTGSKPPTLSILIVDTVKSGSQWPRASSIGVSMLVILALFFLASRRLASAGERKARS